jgi:hypothetical protein
MSQLIMTAQSGNVGKASTLNRGVELIRVAPQCAVVIKRNPSEDLRDHDGVGQFRQLLYLRP